MSKIVSYEDEKSIERAQNYYTPAKPDEADPVRTQINPS